MQADDDVAHPADSGEAPAPSSSLSSSSLSSSSGPSTVRHESASVSESRIPTEPAPSLFAGNTAFVRVPLDSETLLISPLPKPTTNPCYPMFRAMVNTMMNFLMDASVDHLPSSPSTVAFNLAMGFLGAVVFGDPEILTYILANVARGVFWAQQLMRLPVAETYRDAPVGSAPTAASPPALNRELTPQGDSSYSSRSVSSSASSAQPPRRITRVTTIPDRHDIRISTRVAPDSPLSSAFASNPPIAPGRSPRVLTRQPVSDRSRSSRSQSPDDSRSHSARADRSRSPSRSPSPARTPHTAPRSSHTHGSGVPHAATVLPTVPALTVTVPHSSSVSNAARYRGGKHPYTVSMNNIHKHSIFSTDADDYETWLMIGEQFILAEIPYLSSEELASLFATRLDNTMKRSWMQHRTDRPTERDMGSFRIWLRRYTTNEQAVTGHMTGLLSQVPSAHELQNLENYLKDWLTRAITASRNLAPFQENPLTSEAILVYALHLVPELRAGPAFHTQRELLHHQYQSKRHLLQSAMMMCPAQLWLNECSLHTVIAGLATRYRQGATLHARASATPLVYPVAATQLAPPSAGSLHTPPLPNSQQQTDSHTGPCFNCGQDHPSHECRSTCIWGVCATKFPKHARNQCPKSNFRLRRPQGQQSQSGRRPYNVSRANPATAVAPAPPAPSQ